MNGRVWWSLLIGVAAFSCGDDSGGPRTDTTDASFPATDVDGGSDASSPMRECDQIANGTPCGRPNSGMHCIYDACLKNVCGDGVKSGDEECDDGDEIDFDGCSARCKLDTPGCGNGVKDPTEECDDGNRVNTDSCTAACKMAKCGDGIVGPGEQCDDANSNDGDGCTMACRSTGDAGATDGGRDAGGSGSSDAGARDSGADAETPDAAAPDAGGSDSDSGAPEAGLTPDAAADAAADPEASVPDAAVDSGADLDASPGNDSSAPDATIDSAVDAAPPPDGGSVTDGGSACTACRETLAPEGSDQSGTGHRNYLGVDILGGCFEAINSEFEAPAGDPTFIQECTNVVTCAHAHNCAWSEGPEVAGCYCGPISVDACAQTGPAPNAPCRAEWEAATRSTVNSEVQVRLTDLAYPAGWAYFVLKADKDYCADACLPK